MNPFEPPQTEQLKKPAVWPFILAGGICVYFNITAWGHLGDTIHWGFHSIWMFAYLTYGIGVAQVLK